MANVLEEKREARRRARAEGLALNVNSAAAEDKEEVRMQRTRDYDWREDKYHDRRLSRTLLTSPTSGISEPSSTTTANASERRFSRRWQSSDDDVTASAPKSPPAEESETGRVRRRSYVGKELSSDQEKHSQRRLQQENEEFERAEKKRDEEEQARSADAARLRQEKEFKMVATERQRRLAEDEARQAREVEEEAREAEEEAREAEEEARVAEEEARQAEEEAREAEEEAKQAEDEARHVRQVEEEARQAEEEARVAEEARCMRQVAEEARQAREADSGRQAREAEAKEVAVKLQRSVADKVVRTTAREAANKAVVSPPRKEVGPVSRATKEMQPTVKKEKEDTKRQGRRRGLGGLTHEKKALLKKLIVEYALADLQREEQERVAEKKNILATRMLPLPKNLASLNEAELTALCYKYHTRICSIEKEKYDIEQKIGKQEFELNELTVKMSDVKGKFVKPVLKKISKTDSQLTKYDKKSNDSPSFHIDLKPTGKPKYALDEDDQHSLEHAHSEADLHSMETVSLRHK